MKKCFNILIIAIFILSIGRISKAQDCTYYFPKKPGAEVVMKSYDDKDKLTSVNKSKVVEIEGNTIKIESEMFDGKEKPLAKSNFTVTCEKGEFVMDMSSYFKGMNMDAYKDMDVKIETEAMHMPATLKAGDALDDGEMTIVVSNQGFKMMTIKVRIFNRKVEKLESMTTPAGTFDCAKITYDIDSKVVVSASGKGVEWISKNVGVVKSESYNSKGKMVGYTLLTSIK